MHVRLKKIFGSLSRLVRMSTGQRFLSLVLEAGSRQSRRVSRKIYYTVCFVLSVKQLTKLSAGLFAFPLFPLMRSMPIYDDNRLALFELFYLTREINY